MENSKYNGYKYGSTDSFLNRSDRGPVFSGANSATAIDENAPALKFPALRTRLDVIKVRYSSEKSTAGKKRYRKKAQGIKQAIGDQRRKRIVSAGSFVLALVLLMTLLQIFELI
jgi:hypothetical protein